MTPSARDRRAELLDDVARRGSFSTSCTAPVDDLHIEVRGVGPLVFPVPEEQARRLCEIGRLARYGRESALATPPVRASPQRRPLRAGERTLLDSSVRSTWEIPKSRVKLDQRCFAATLSPALGRLGRDLGLPVGCQLAAELHSMLVAGGRPRNLERIRTRTALGPLRSVGPQPLRGPGRHRERLGRRRG